MGTEAVPTLEKRRNVGAFSAVWSFRTGRGPRALGGVSDEPYGKRQRESGSRTALASGGEFGAVWIEVRPGLRLWRPRVFQERVLLTLDLPESVPQFDAERLGNLQQDAAVFGQREQTESLAIVHRHHFQRR